jgi:hypothetical protein
MAEHKTLTSKADAAIYLRLIEKGVPAATLTRLANQGKSADQIAAMYETTGGETR